MVEIILLFALGICMMAAGVVVTFQRQQTEIATLKRQLKALQDSTITFSNNMNEYMKNQNDINQILTDRIKRGY